MLLVVLVCQRKFNFVREDSRRSVLEKTSGGKWVHGIDLVITTIYSNGRNFAKLKKMKVNQDRFA